MSHDQIPHVTCEHLMKLQKGDEKEHIVIDVRDTLEYDAAHIEGSHNVPRRELSLNIGNIVPDMMRHVVVVFGAADEPDIRTIHAQLKELGYTNVEFLAGGFDKWCEISDPELDIDTDLTPEEQGFVGDVLEEETADPESEQDEPLF